MSANPLPGLAIAPPPAADLIEFLLQQAQVHYLNGSLQHCEQGYTMRRRVLRQHNLIYLIRGRAQWVVEDQPIDLEPDCWTLVPPGRWHHAQGQTRRITLMSYHFNATLPGGRDLFAVLRVPSLLTTQRTTRLAQMVRLSRREYERSSGSTTAYMLGFWTQLLVPESLREANRQGLVVIERISSTVARIVPWMREHLDQPVNLAQLETISGYSGQHLNRLFNEALGVTAMQYLNQLRMQRAAALLHEGRLSIAAIGQAVGLDNPYYFSRVFRAHHGVSPRRWQQAQCSDNPTPR
jgi:AraC-like DNA-binding protein